MIRTVDCMLQASKGRFAAGMPLRA